MGLLYTKLYLDFEANNWKEVSHNPTIFEAIAEGVTIEVYDTSQISRKLTFRKGGKIQVFRVVGKFRLNWADEDII